MFCAAGSSVGVSSVCVALKAVFASVPFALGFGSFGEVVVRRETTVPSGFVNSSYAMTNLLFCLID